MARALTSMLAFTVLSLAGWPAPTPEEGAGGQWSVISDLSGPATRPAFAVTEGLTAVAWVEAETGQQGPLRFQLVDDLEPVLPTALELSPGRVVDAPALAWTGQAFVVAWVEQEPDRVVLRTAAVDPEPGLSTESRAVFWLEEGRLESPDLAWSGEFLGLAVGAAGPDKRMHPAVLPLDAVGKPLGSMVVLGGELAATGGPALAPGPAGLLLAWTETGSDSLLHVDRWPAPEPPQGLMALAGSRPMRHPAIAASPRGFALAWHERESAEAQVWARAFDTIGQPLAQPAKIVGSEYARDPRLVWDGEKYLLAVESGLALLARLSAHGTLRYPLQWLNFRDGYAARGIQVAAHGGRPLLVWSDLGEGPWRIVLFRPDQAPTLEPPDGPTVSLDLGAGRFAGGGATDPVSCAPPPFVRAALALPDVQITRLSTPLEWEVSRGVPTAAHLFVGKRDGPPGNVALRLTLEARESESEREVSRFVWTHPTYLIETGCSVRSHTIPISGIQVFPGQELWMHVDRLGSHALDPLATEAQLLGVRLLVQTDAS